MNSIQNTQTLIIKHLMNKGEFDYRAIAVKLMERDAVLFAELAGLTNHIDSWVTEARVHFNANAAVSCIKAIRSDKGIGLWEAKTIFYTWRAGGIVQCEAYRWTNEMNDILHTLRFG